MGKRDTASLYDWHCCLQCSLTRAKKHRQNKLIQMSKSQNKKFLLLCDFAAIVVMDW